LPATHSFVLSVARVEPRKNSLALALAVRDLPYRLVLAGSVLPGNEPYLAAVRKAAPGLIHIPHLEHGLVRHVHAAAGVHALPSWYETTGLSTVEALATGTPVVVGSGPCERDYFADCAAFCRPASVKSVRRAVLRALEGPVGNERDVARSYSWDRTAQELIDAYGLSLRRVAR
jgi:glycosyltransferase involved in cell wall biosynthesis